MVPCAWYIPHSPNQPSWERVTRVPLVEQRMSGLGVGGLRQCEERLSPTVKYWGLEAGGGLGPDWGKAPCSLWSWAPRGQLLSC